MTAALTPRAAAATPQARLVDTLRAGLDALDARLRAAAAGLPAERWGERRADGGWSAGEILEHLCLANEQYLAPMRALADDGAAREGDGRWRQTFLAGLLRWSLESPRRLPAPQKIQPGPTPRPDVLVALLATHAELRTLVARAERLDWRRMRMTSPFAAFVRPNFGDACLIMLRHGERHAGQLERLVAERRAR